MHVKSFLKIAGLLTAAALSVATAWAHSIIKDNGGYVITWMPGSIVMDVKLPSSPALSDGTSQSGSVVAAMDTWNAQLGVLQFQSAVVAPGAYELGNDINEIVMDSTIEGEAFDSNTLAVTISFRSSNERIESDIVFNTAFTWDSYRGSLLSSMDIRRVAIHELGHVLGLAHPDQNGQAVTAIMNSTASAIDTLQPDDVAGAQSLYGPPGFVPVNDHFANATTITLGSGMASLTGTSVAATAEAGEPAHAGEPARRSVWWRWTAPANGNLTVTTSGSVFDTVLAVYTGTSVGALTGIAANDDENPGIIRTGTVTFTATTGTTYYFAVDGWNGFFGAISLNLNFTSTDAAPSLSIAQNVVEVALGETAYFSVSVQGTPTPTLQWQRRAAGTDVWTNLTEGGDNNGTATHTLSVRATSVTMTGDEFRCVATNSFGSGTSGTASLKVHGPPLITAQSQSLTLSATGSGAISVTTVSASPVTYQWFKDGVSLGTSAQGASLLFDYALDSDAGSYQVVVSNSHGSATSTPISVTVNALAGVVRVHSASWMTLFERTDGSWWLAGYDLLSFDSFTYGNDITRPLSLTDNAVMQHLLPMPPAMMSAGDNYLLFLLPDGSLHCAGGITVNSLVPDEPANSTLIARDVCAIAAGKAHFLFLKTDGTLWAVGQNIGGQLGDGTRTDRDTPVQVATGVVAVSTYYQRTYFIKYDGTLWAMGNNFLGALGDGTTVWRETPVQIAAGVRTVTAGQLASCFIKNDGTLWAMGPNDQGQLGIGTYVNQSLPVQVASNVRAVAANYMSTLFVKEDGTLWSMGLGTDGQLLDSGTSSRSLPVQVATGVVAVGGSQDASFMVKNDGSLWSAGWNQNGRLGVGLGSSTVPTLTQAAGGQPGAPAKPLALTASLFARAGLVRLNWAITSGATSYEVWRGTTSEFAASTKIADRIENPIYFDQTAEAGFTYHYWVRASNYAGGSPVSDATTQTIPVLTPPGDFNADGTSDLLLTNIITGGRSVRLMDGTALGSEVSFGSVDAEWSLIAGDFSADGKADLLLQNTVNGDCYLWLMNGATVTSSIFLGNIGAQWSVAGTGDLNSDGQTDILWSNTTTGDRYVWLMNGTTLASSVYLDTLNPRWLIAGTGDFNADGQTDIVWQHIATGERLIWLMQGTTKVSQVSLGLVSTALRIVQVGDFNADGKPDLVWQNLVSGELLIWLMNGTDATGSVSLGTIGTDWIIGQNIVPTPSTQVASDFNGDGQSDLLWSSTTNGDRYIWLMNGTRVSSSVYLSNVAPAWTVVTGDFNADGQSDLLWSSTANGDRYVWLMDGTRVSSSVFLGNVAPSWTVVAGDFNSDGQSDLLWSSTANGDRYVWLMDGTQVSSSVFLGNVAPDWTVVTGDFNSDGQSDLLWSNGSNGDRYFWLMNGTRVASSVFLGTVNPIWLVSTGDYNADGQSDLLWSNSSDGDRYVWLMDGTSVASDSFLSNVGKLWHIAK